MVSDYQPGVCNINKDERKKRLFSGIFGALGLIAIALYSSFYALNFYLLIGVFLFSFISFTGFLQAWYSFCAYYGIRGVYNVRNNLKEVSNNGGTQDLYKSILIIFQSLVFSIATVLLFLVFF